MIEKLPDDLLAFLREGRRLSYDVENSIVGRIKLKDVPDLAVTTIETDPDCQSIIDDPYFNLEGQYQIEVVDLVAESEHYDTEGLLCWIVAMKQFGCVDPEHGDVIAFPGVTWTELAANPLPYLDAQWQGAENDAGIRALPWMHFPFALSEAEITLSPYGAKCPAHDASVDVASGQKSSLFEIVRQIALDKWVDGYQTTFPCSGVPVSEEELLCCPVCRAAEEAWAQDVDSEIVAVNVAPFKPGWLRCPGCDKRFAIRDSGVYSDGYHLTCGQKINIVD